MAGTEAFTILAILEAKDRISDVMERVDTSLDRFSATAERAASAAEASGSAIDASLLQTASGLDATEVATARVSAARAQLALATQEQAGAERELLATQQQAAAAASGDAAAMDAQANAVRRMAAADRDAAAAQRQLRTAEASQAATADAAAGATNRAAAATNTAATAARGGSSAFKTANKAMLGVGVAAGAIVYESLKAATSFQTLTTRLVTSAGEQKSNLELVRQGIIQVSNATGVMADDVAKNMYIVESAGYHGADGIKVLSAATQGAKIEGADFQTVANAVTDVLNDYHYSADKAGLATSQLVKAVSYGKTNFQSLSSAMNNVLPFASSLGLKLNDVVGVLANMTAHGVSAQRASMNIANAMRSLAAPTNVMSKEFEKFGLTTHQVQESLSTRGLAGTMTWLSGVARSEAPKVGQTYNEALKKLMGTATGFQVALMSTGENTEKVSEAIKGIGEASTDAQGNVEGFGDVQQTLGFKMDQAKAAIHNAGIEIGTALLPPITKLIGEIAKLLVPMASWIQHHQKLTEVILAVGLALGALSVIIMTITGVIALLTSEIGLVVIGIAAFAAGMIYLYTHSTKVRDVLNAIGSALKTAFVASWHAAADVVNWFGNTVIPAVQMAINSLISWFQSHGKVFSDAWSSIVHEIQNDAKWFDNNVIQFIQDRINTLVSWFRSHGEELETVWKAIWTVLKTTVTVWYDAFFKPWLTVMKAVWTTAWGALRDGFKVVWAAISGIAKTQMDLVLDTIGVILDVLTGHWQKAWNDLKKLASDALRNVKSTILNVTSNFGTLLYNAGVNVIKGLISGIKSQISGVASAISSVTGTIKNHLPWSPAKEGPLSGAGAPEIGGANITKMIARGIVSGKSQITAAMSQVTGAATTSLAAGSTAGALGLGPGVPISSVSRAGTGTVLVINNSFQGAQVIGEQAMDQLAQKVGNRLATRVLPAGGVRIKM